MRKIYIIILLLVLTGCGKYDPYKMPDDVSISLNENVFEVYEKHTSKELINEANVIILTSEELDTEQIGKHEIELEYKYKKRKYKYIVNYDVVDNAAPVLISSPTKVTKEIGSEDNLCNISYGDYYDANPTCRIEGVYDLNLIGTYYLKYVIEDSSGNITTEDFTLNVVYKINNTPVKTIPHYIYIDDILKYKNENTSIGIDVSRWQGKIDFNKVKEAGIEFVIMRIGYQSDEADNYELDMRFNEYYKQAKDAGLDVSVYVYTNASSPEGARKAARFIINTLDGDKVNLPIAYDFEDWKDFNSYHMSLRTLALNYLAFEDELNKHGYDAMLYSSKYYLENVWSNFENTNVWLAHYIDQTTYQGDYMLWQMTDKGAIDGIEENTVDIDILYKNKK